MRIGGDLAPADGAGARAGDKEGARLEADVFGRRFEQLGGEFLGAFPNGFGVVEHRGPTDRSATAAEGADPARTLVGVPEQHPNRIHRDAELLRRDLCPCRLMALPVG